MLIVTRLDETIISSNGCASSSLPGQRGLRAPSIARHRPADGTTDSNRVLGAFLRKASEGLAGGGRPVMRDLGYFSEFALFIIFLRNRESAPTH